MCIYTYYTNTKYLYVLLSVDVSVILVCVEWHQVARPEEVAHAHTGAAAAGFSIAQGGAASPLNAGWDPGFRQEQGQPGLPREPVWAIRVAPHPYH